MRNALLQYHETKFDNYVQHVVPHKAQSKQYNSHSYSIPIASLLLYCITTAFPYLFYYLATLLLLYDTITLLYTTTVSTCFSYISTTFLHYYYYATC